VVRVSDSNLLPRVGLCANCRHASRIVSSRGSEFWRCLRADTDRSFAKYPALPVRECRGVEAKDEYHHDLPTDRK
jgi:hypothetical protein